MRSNAASAQTGVIGARRWRPVRRLTARWRGSLRIRVVTMSLLVGLILLGAVGVYLYEQVANGLVEEKRTVASAEASVLTRAAQNQFRRTDLIQTADNVEKAARTIVGQAAGTERSRYVLLIRSDANPTTNPALVVPDLRSGDDVLPADIPEALKQRVDADPSTQQMQIITIQLRNCPATGVCTSPGPATDVPAWAIGQQVALPLAGEYQMYFVYPMTTEHETLALVGRTFVYGGIALVVLFGLLAWFVTRMVVDPVRRASIVAERFAGGRLNERMKSRGTDEIASLAKSFNGMAASIQQQIGQLENLSRVQQRFVSDVSHELRTPLTTIRMAGDLIHDSRADLDPVMARSAELLHDELDRFEDLLTDLLEISRFDAGAAALDVDTIDLRTSVARVVAAASALAARKGSEITIVGDLAPVHVEADPRRIERVLRNLVVNAIEHGEGRPIEVTIGENDSAVAVSVRDHGVGLRPGESGMVFNRFWRADPARARTTGGTGLGLAISKEDALLHQGWLQAWGVQGEGSCFRLTLPRRAGSPIDTSPLPLNPLVTLGLGRLLEPGPPPPGTGTGTAGPGTGGPGPVAAARSLGRGEPFLGRET